VAGYSFGSWIGMQLLMRRPEIEGFISVAPQPNTYDFSFLAPCPSSGLIINGEADKVAPEKDVAGLVEKLKAQKGILITHKTLPDANHFFSGQMDTLIDECGDYLDRRMAGELVPEPAAKRIR
jgi:alpha/beta superfamily hydrolase